MKVDVKGQGDHLPKRRIFPILIPLKTKSDPPDLRLRGDINRTPARSLEEAHLRIPVKRLSKSSPGKDGSGSGSQLDLLTNANRVFTGHKDPPTSRNVRKNPCSIWFVSYARMNMVTKPEPPSIRNPTSDCRTSRAFRYPVKDSSNRPKPRSKSFGRRMLCSVDLRNIPESGESDRG